jgi:hypothetical protein
VNLGPFYVVAARIPYPDLGVVWKPLNRDVWTLALLVGKWGVAVGRRP